jgi:outer membrane immunogenic protein
LKQFEYFCRSKIGLPHFASAPAAQFTDNCGLRAIAAGGRTDYKHNQRELKAEDQPMKKISSLLTAIAAVAVISAPAVAADMRMPMKAAPPPVVAVFNWTGFYIGGFVGGAVADGDAESTPPANGLVTYNGPLGNSYSLDSSFIGGGTIGYNWQPVGSQFVLGIEGEVGYLRLRRSVADANNTLLTGPNGFDSTHIGDWYGVIAGRAGIAFDRVLLYAKGGVAFVDKSYNWTDTCVVAPCGPSTLSITNSDTQVTWAAGAGVEWAFAPNWSLKGEYLYIDTKETTTQSAIAGGAGPAAGLLWTNSHSDPGIHTGKFGVNYRF